MIIRCPDCTTGFKLPDERVSEDPMKVRCSRCSHIFRVGLVGGEPILFDEEGERLAEEAQQVKPDEAGESSGAGDASDDENDSEYPSPPSNLSKDRAPGSNTMLGTGSVPDTDGRGETDREAEGAGDSGAGASGGGRETQVGKPAVEPADEAPVGDAPPDGGSGRQTMTGMPGEESPADGGSPSESASSKGSRRTQKGVPAADPDASADDEDDSEEYNPFPHANSDIGPKKSKAITGGENQDSAPGDEASSGEDEGLDLFEDEQEDPEPADEENLRETEKLEKPEPTPENTSPRTTQRAPAGPKQPPHAQGPPDQHGPPGGEDEGIELEAGGGDAGEQWEPEANDDYHKEYFDPATGRKRTAGSGNEPNSARPTSQDGATSTASSPEPGTGGPPAGSSSPQDNSPSANQPQAAGDSTADVQSSPGGGQSRPGSPSGGAADPSSSSPGSPEAGTTGFDDRGLEQGDGGNLELETADQRGTGGGAGNVGSTATSASAPARQSNSYALDDVDRVDGQQFGPSGFQKFANVLLVGLIVGASFLTVVAAQNGWFLDFANFRQMLQVAFQDGEYEPREEWTDSSPPPVQKAVPDDPITFEHVVAQTVALEGGDDHRLLVLQGDAKNVADEDVGAVEVRGLVYDEQGKILAEQQAPLGASIAPSELRSLDSPEGYESLMPDSPADLGSGKAQPFTIVFAEIPEPVAEGNRLDYAVEVASNE